MNRALAIIAVLALPSTTLTGLVAQTTEPTVTEAVIATAVADRQPQGVAESFPTSVGTLYCFTRVTGAEPNTNIDHVWYFGDAEVARTSLSIGAASWRTWSSKTIPATATGSWRVDVMTKDGKVLNSLAFTIQ